MTRAPLLETLSNTLIRHRHAATEAWSASAAGVPTEASVPTASREGRSFSGDRGCFPPYACRRDRSQDSPPLTGGGPTVTLHPVRDALLRGTSAFVAHPACAQP